MLAAHFAEKLALANALPVHNFSADALALLAGHDWPGNVCELEDLVHRAVLLAGHTDIGADDLVLADGSRLASASPAARERPQIEALVGQTVETVERELILKTLAHCRGNRTCASGILGISVRTMRNKLKTFIEAGIPVAPAL